MTTTGKRPQVEKFRKSARELGCDESEARFQEALRAVAKHKPVEAADGDLANLIQKGDPADVGRIAKKPGNAN